MGICVLFNDIDNSEENLGEIEATIIVEGTENWQFVFRYENNTAMTETTLLDGAEVPVLRLKVDKAYTFVFYSSNDGNPNNARIHSFFVPALSFKMDITPGSKNNTISAKMELVGEFPILCAEYCGPAHSRMWGMLIVEA